MSRFGIAVIGAGPAGMAAAARAAAAGRRVVLLDSGVLPGGQYWRHRQHLPPESTNYKKLAAGLRGVEYRAGVTVWWAEPEFGPGTDGGDVATGQGSVMRDEVTAESRGLPTSPGVAAEPGFGTGATGADVAAEPGDLPRTSRGDAAAESGFGVGASWGGGGDGAGFVLRTSRGDVVAGRVVLAMGAHDRVVPFPGWELPGVTTAGGAQALLKGSGVLVGRRIVVAGTGPFLLPVAAGLARAGARVVGVFEANSPARLAFRTPASKAAEAARYAATFARYRIPYRTRYTVVAAHGGGEVEAVTVRGPRGDRTISCDAVAIGFGFVPAIELGTLLGCATRLDGDTNLMLAVDERQRTSVPGVYAAGEVTGVGGAELAIVEGTIAGAAAAEPNARPDRKLARRRSALRRFANALKENFPVPPQWPDALHDDTLICRCEEVPYRAVREAVTELGATDARTVKLLCRTGMGWCQGRMCGYPTACLTATLRNRPVTTMDLRAFAQRPFATPITMGELAGNPDLIE